jgi:hypothetical protein
VNTDWRHSVLYELAQSLPVVHDKVGEPLAPLMRMSCVDIAPPRATGYRLQIGVGHFKFCICALFSHLLIETCKCYSFLQKSSNFDQKPVDIAARPHLLGLTPQPNPTVQSAKIGAIHYPLNASYYIYGINKLSLW